MVNILRRASAWVVAVIMLCTLCPISVWAGNENSNQTTVLFTHDLHSHFLPQSTENGGESGGYARLKTALDREREKHPDALTLDGGDFSIGSLIQTLYTTKAPELRTMGALGYDAVTAGNHEFDHEGIGFAQMLNAAALSGDPLPTLLMSNYTPSKDNPNCLDIQRAMATYGIQDTMILERGGITYGLFGLMGEDAHSCAPASGFELGDMEEAAQRCVDALKGQGAQFIICLSHSGTNEKKKLSEDEQLAQAVDGIDLIISGHTHTTLEQPVVVEDTYIVSSGPYCENLGSITLSWNETGEKTLEDYRLIPIDETVPDDEEISLLIEDWKRQVGGTYLSRYGLSYDKVLTTAGFSLPLPEGGKQQGNGLGELVSDAYLWAAETMTGEDTGNGTVAVVAAGVLRAPLNQGAITASMAFDVLSMGVGEDGTSGFPLISCYLTGKELKAVAEVDASVTPIMPEAQLYMSGMQYSFNANRMFFNRVTKAQLYESGISVQEAPVLGKKDEASGLGYTVTSKDKVVADIENDRLYRVVTGMYSAQMLGTVKEKSFGLLTIEPKDAQGNPITDFSEHILRDKNGNEIKEWYALAAYLQSFGENGLPEWYAHPDGRKDVSHSWNPWELIKSPNWITLVVLLVVVLAAVLVVRLGRRLFFRKYRRRGW